MNPAQLLATSKSLIGMRDDNSPYKMCTTNLVPNFGAKKNPFAAVAESTAVECRPWESAPVMAKVSPQVASDESLQLFDSEMKPAGKPAEQQAAPIVPVENLLTVKPAIAPAVCETRAILTRGPSAEVVLPRPISKVRQERSSGGGLVSQIFAWGKVGRNVQPPAQRAVQAELALSQITVKRNCLHDADLKVVSRPSAVRVSEASAPRPMADIKSAKVSAGGFSGALLKFFALGQMRAR